METTLEMLDGVEEEMMARSFLFANPVSYRDGVGATADAVRAMLAKIRVTELETERRGEETP